jgi:nucleotide-binding universal stress UspA family protein
MTQIRRIVCPTDFSPTAGHALAYAAELARSFGAELLLLYVLPELNYPIRGLGMASAFPHLRDELHTRAKEQLAEVQKSLPPGVRTSIELRDGAPHDMILACAKERGADMIVMGTNGHTGIKHALLGSSAERVVRLAECPVLTVRSNS